MIQIDKEFYSSPYYFLLRDKENKYSLYFSVEENLTEARKKDKVIHFKKPDISKVKKYLYKTLKEKKIKSTKKIKTDLEELVNSDGSMANSRMPILDPSVHPIKTMDQTIASAVITDDPIIGGYGINFRESIENELEEIDMSKSFGYDETEDLSGKETYEYYKDELEMDPEDAKERTEEQGKDPSGKKDKKSKYSKHRNFIGKLTLSEIQKQKMVKMVEDILTKKKNSSDGDINKKDVNASYVLMKNLKTLKKQAEKEGLSISELIKLLKSE
jgi:hypothetical protein